MAETLQIELVFALPEQVFRRRLSLPVGSTVAEAVERSGLHADMPELAQQVLKYGIWSRRVPADHVLHDGDRVEVYRPLQLDPMEARRRRAVQRD